VAVGKEARAGRVDGGNRLNPIYGFINITRYTDPMQSAVRRMKPVNRFRMIEVVFSSGE
jgi:hypothetical protein